MIKSYAVSPAANRWQTGLLKALIEQGLNITLLSHFPEPLWPKGKYRPGNFDDLDPQFDNRLVHYWNMPFLRSHSLNHGHLMAFREVCEQKGKPLVVISYNPEPYAVAVGLHAQNHYNIPWIDICADSYEPGNDWSGYAQGASEAKGHIFLSYKAFQKCPFPVKLHLDGGVSLFNLNPKVSSDRQSMNKKIVLYTGMMSIWGGVSLLLKAFEKIKDPEVRLWLCGHGNNPDLDEALRRDSRIHFFGFIPESKLKTMYEEASVLVNPRPSHIDGNSMNFPSKILVYLSYGKPVISTWTPGLSPEYRDVLEVLTEETEICLARTIENVFAWPDEIITQKSQKIFEFLLKKKTWEHQSSGLIKWIFNEII